LYVPQIATGFLICLDQASERDRAGETGGSTADEKNIHRHCFSIRLIGQNQPVERKRRLMNAR
jgi:hypothetical protein